MVENIFVGIICAIALGVGVWGWWFDNGGSLKRGAKENSTDERTEGKEKN